MFLLVGAIISWVIRPRGDDLSLSIAAMGDVAGHSCIEDTDLEERLPAADAPAEMKKKIILQPTKSVRNSTL